jgi:hypothetical protein
MSMETPIDSTSVDQRDATDRRTLSWRTFLYGFLFSRRRVHRRSAEVEVLFLDWHHPWLFFLSIGTMLLSCADAFLTLQLLERGMHEINPAMLYLLGHGAAAFAGVKLGMTAAGIFVLVFLAHVHFLNRFRTGLFLTAFFSGYAILVCYELVHLFSLL